MAPCFSPDAPPVPPLLLFQITAWLRRTFPAIDHLERNAVIDGDTFLLHVAVSALREGRKEKIRNGCAGSLQHRPHWSREGGTASMAKVRPGTQP